MGDHKCVQPADPLFKKRGDEHAPRQIAGTIPRLIGRPDRWRAAGIHHHGVPFGGPKQQAVTFPDVKYAEVQPIRPWHGDANQHHQHESGNQKRRPVPRTFRHEAKQQRGQITRRQHAAGRNHPEGRPAAGVHQRVEDADQPTGGLNEHSGGGATNGGERHSQQQQDHDGPDQCRCDQRQDRAAQGQGEVQGGQKRQAHHQHRHRSEQAAGHPGCRAQSAPGPTAENRRCQPADKSEMQPLHPITPTAPDRVGSGRIEVDARREQSPGGVLEWSRHGLRQRSAYEGDGAHGRKSELKSGIEQIPRLPGQQDQGGEGNGVQECRGAVQQAPEDVNRRNQKRSNHRHVVLHQNEIQRQDRQEQNMTHRRRQRQQCEQTSNKQRDEREVGAADHQQVINTGIDVRAAQFGRADIRTEEQGAQHLGADKVAGFRMNQGAQAPGEAVARTFGRRFLDCQQAG